MSSPGSKLGGRPWRSAVLALWAAAMACILSCAAPGGFNRFGPDVPLVMDVAVWLAGGAQSRITPLIRQEAEALIEGSRRRRLGRALQYVWDNFEYDRSLNAAQFSRTAEQLFIDRKLGGCSDFALAELTMIRALGIPARLVVTVNVDWIKLYRTNPLALPEGHSFIEAFLENDWNLVDSTYRRIYKGYKIEAKSYPHNEFFIARGRDFWELGITSTAKARAMLTRAAESFHDDFFEPGYKFREY